MNETGAVTSGKLEAIYRSDARRVLATLIRLLGDFDRAEEALADAFAAAAAQWPRDGIPKKPFAWLVSAGRFRAIDRLRRKARHDASLKDLAMQFESEAAEPPEWDDKLIEDDQLRLIFTCCHPALSPDAQVAMTLREVCGLRTEEIAAAFLVSAPTVAQRIVRAKARIRDENIPYETPASDELSGRLEYVLRAVYLVFNEGYLASSGASVTRADLSAEAIRLGRLLVQLLPDPEALGLLALMLLQESRHAARATASGAIVLLQDQDRSHWDRGLIEEGLALVRRAFAGGEVGSYAIQAAIAAEHAHADSIDRTDWRKIVSLYNLLLRADPSPVAELNRAAAMAECDGAEAGLALIDAILARGDLADYHPAYAARAELCRRLSRLDEARASYAKALSLAQQGPVRELLMRQALGLGAGPES
ncbi:sigma-70 family RNA polymerase sigma factor [Mesorhizobium sp. BAC0120]|uniref:RNA polymerase sigma factor n=1 Tax=Mesorhizobium sp. BAC0120 TaxID=3090670 RepID=UPI00298D463C|nr:sigma-70 family RNA polymerase sigma factor [Mesorhizobium sp. BAC0120]MDW6021360.1 sigma-70 family RNA polymerase sigma factor [Mesorhizobium sp. BAC0120]